MKENTVLIWGIMLTIIVGVLISLGIDWSVKKLSKSNYEYHGLKFRPARVITNADGSKWISGTGFKGYSWGGEE